MAQYCVHIIIIMDLQMVKNDYIYSTKQLTLQKKTTFDQSTNLKVLLPRYNIRYLIVQFARPNGTFKDFVEFWKNNFSKSCIS